MAGEWAEPHPSGPLACTRTTANRAVGHPGEYTLTPSPRSSAIPAPPRVNTSVSGTY